MNLILFLFIAAFFSLTLGEFGQFPFASTGFSFSVTDLLLSLSLIALLIWNIAIKKNLILPRNFIFLMLFWAIGIFSLFLSLDLSGWFYLLRFLIYSSVFYLTYSLVNSRILGLGEYLSLIKITSVILAIIGLIQLIVFPDLESLTTLGYDPHKYRVFSTFLDPNFLGAFLSFCMALTTYELINKKYTNLKLSFIENKWLFLSVAILALTILLTFSRSAYLMSGIALTIILASKSYKLLGAFILAGFILYLTFPPFSDRIQGAINVDKSANERFYSWEKGITIFQQNPILGVGFNNIRNYSQSSSLLKVFTPDGGNSGAGIDSSLIFVMATTGLIGFMVFIIFIIRIILDQVTSLTSQAKSLYNLKLEPFKFLNRVWELPGLTKWYPDSQSASRVVKSNFLSIPLLALTAGLLIDSFFINSLFYPPIMFVWFSLLGTFYGLQSES